MAQDTEKYLDNVNMIPTFEFHAMPGIYWLTEDIFTFQQLFHGAKLIGKLGRTAENAERFTRRK
jgi:hypothetical protein